MDSLNGQAPENPCAQPQHISKPLMFALVFLTAVISGAGGYWLGVRKTVLPTTKLASLPTPEVTLEPTPTMIIQPSSLTLLTNQYAITPIVGWKTYTNTAYGYSLQYPFGSTIEPLDLRENPTTSRIVSFWNTQKVLLIYIEVESIKEKDALPITGTFYQWVIQHFLPGPGGKISRISVNDHDAVLEESPQEAKQKPLGVSYDVYIEKNSNTILKLESSRVLQDSNDEAIFSKMLSTLQFTTF